MGFDGTLWDLPSGKRLHNYGKIPMSNGKLISSMAMFISYAKLPEGNEGFPRYQGYFHGHLTKCLNQWDFEGVQP